MSPNGKYFVFCGKDRSVRLWEKTQEILVLEDERETVRDQEAGDRRAVAGEGGVSLASLRTAETERGAEMLMEAPELYKSHEVSGDTQLPALMLSIASPRTDLTERSDRMLSHSQVSYSTQPVSEAEKSWANLAKFGALLVRFARISFKHIVLALLLFAVLLCIVHNRTEIVELGRTQQIVRKELLVRV